MNMLIVVAVLCSFMATSVHSAPLLEDTSASGQPVSDPEFYLVVERCQMLINKVLFAINETHKSCIHTETLILHSASENMKLQHMATTLGIPSAPTLKPLSEDFTMEASLKRISEGLQLHRALLGAVEPRLTNAEMLTELKHDIRDLLIQIHHMLKKVQGAKHDLPTATTVALRLSGDYEVQVATHLTLVQLQTFGRDVARSLRNIAHLADEQATESSPVQ